MLTQQYIKELLYQHECVTVPNFGAFLTRSINILIVNDSDLFVPPRKEVSFNSLLSNNDGILAHYISIKEKVSFEQALRRIEKEVISWKQRLNTQQLSFPGIGEMRLNSQKKITFYPDGKINFDLSAFGLSSFYRKPINKLNTNIKEPNPPLKMEKENKENLMFTPGKKEEKRKPFAKYAAIGLIGIALAGSLYYFGNQYIANEKIKSMDLAQKKIKSNVQKANFDLGSISKINLSFDSKPEVIKDDTPLDKTYFSVVAGSFRSIENAERLLKKLIVDGFDAAFAEVNPEGLYRVAYGRFDSKRKALNLHNYVRYALKEDAWFLVEK